MYTRILDPASGEMLDHVRRDGDGVVIPADPDNTEWQRYEAWRAEGNAPTDPPAPVRGPPDGPTLSDYRVALTLWGRIDDVTARIAGLVASSDPRQALLGRIARERFEYANNVLRAQLLQLRAALGFTAAEIDESLWRPAQVARGDLSGVWPPPAA